MKGYSKKVLVGVSFASFMLGSFQGGALAEGTKGEQVSYRNVLKNGAGWCTITSARISSFIKKCWKISLLRKGYNLLICHKDRLK